jgi:hypothetical protein
MWHVAPPNLPSIISLYKGKNIKNILRDQLVDANSESSKSHGNISNAHDHFGVNMDTLNLDLFLSLIQLWCKYGLFFCFNLMDLADP